MKVTSFLLAVPLLTLSALDSRADNSIVFDDTNLLASAEASPAAPAPPTPQQRAALLKQWLAASQAQLRTYEWVETTVVSIGGEEKSRGQNRCYYGVDGKLEKIAVGSAPPQEEPRGPLRRRIAESKRGQMTDYMNSAVALIHEYIPPDPARIQAAIAAGKLSAQLEPAGKQVRLEFGDYLKSGDTLVVSIELPTNRLLGVEVTSYLDSPADPVQLDVTMGVLPDGTLFAERSTLEAPAKKLTVAVDKGGFRHTGG